MSGRKPASPTPPEETTLGDAMESAKEQARELARVIFELWLERQRRESEAA